MHTLSSERIPSAPPCGGAGRAPAPTRAPTRGTAQLQFEGPTLLRLCLVCASKRGPASPRSSVPTSPTSPVELRSTVIQECEPGGRDGLLSPSGIPSGRMGQHRGGAGNVDPLITLSRLGVSHDGDRHVSIPISRTGWHWVQSHARTPGVIVSRRELCCGSEVTPWFPLHRVCALLSLPPAPTSPLPLRKGDHSTG